MSSYRTGNHWGVTIVRSPSGSEERTEGDELVAVVMAGKVLTTDVELAARVAWLLNADGADPAPCHEETWSWRHFTSEQVDGYWIRCTLTGRHDEHKDAHTGLTWRTEGEVSASLARSEPGNPRGYHPTCIETTGIVEFSQGSRTFVCGPDCPPVPSPADSCTCTVAGPDPACIVHKGRRAKGPKPPNPPGCICDGSGRTCPRHGAVI